MYSQPPPGAPAPAPVPGYPAPMPGVAGVYPLATPPKLGTAPPPVSAQAAYATPLKPGTNNFSYEVILLFKKYICSPRDA